MATPLDKKLYDRVVVEAKKRFKVWPSAYASGWVVRRYKELGGRYKSSPITTPNLSRWYDEKWINVCELPKIVPCGRPNASRKDYPYCRPLKRVNPNTPTTVKELSPKELEQRCARKKRDPTKRILP